MVRGHLLLSTSLTEAFGTVLVEAASCGLMVVATRVGGVPEVLPGNMTVFILPEVEDVVRGVGDAIGVLRSGRGGGRDKFHGLVRNMYSWADVARRTERVYDLVTGATAEGATPDFLHGYAPEGGMMNVLPPGRRLSMDEWAGYGAPSAKDRSRSLMDRLKRYYGCGVWAGKLFVIVVVVDYLIYCALEVFWPREGIDICKAWPLEGLSGGEEGEDEGKFLAG